MVGLLLLPPMDGNRTRVMALGNTFAALTELRHFGAPGARFRARFLEREPALEDSDPPFGRSFLLQLPDEGDEVATRELVDLSGQFLFRDLCSPLGRVIDLARAGLPAPPWQARGQYYQTFGLHQLSWPRSAHLRGVSQVLCQKLVQRWLSKDSKPISETIQTWVQEQWTQQGLGAERLHQPAARCLPGSSQEAARDPIFHDMIEPLAAQSVRLPADHAGGGAPPPVELARRRGGRGPAARSRSRSASHRGRWLGEPAAARMIQILRDVAEQATNDWAQKLAELPVRLIEEPGFRLAGAEEAVRHLVATIEQILQHHEPLTKDLTGKAVEAYARLAGSVRAARSRGNAVPQLPAREVVELLRSYAKYRFQSQMFHQVASGFLSACAATSRMSCVKSISAAFASTSCCSLFEPTRTQPQEDGVRPASAGCSSRRGCSSLEEGRRAFPDHPLAGRPARSGRPHPGGDPAEVHAPW